MDCICYYFYWFTMSTNQESFRASSAVNLSFLFFRNLEIKFLGVLV